MSRATRRNRRVGTVDVDTMFESPLVGLGNLGRKQNVTGTATSLTTSTTSVGGMIVAAEPSDRDTWFWWGATLGVSVAGAGFIVLKVWELGLSGSTVTLTEVDTFSRRVQATDPVTTDFGRMFQAIPLGPSAVTRRWAIGGFVTRDAGSSLIGTVKNANGSGKTYAAAVAI